MLTEHAGTVLPPAGAVHTVDALPGVTLTEMPRHGNHSFCCGSGGARMWMEEKLGTTINGNRTEEAVATGAGRRPARNPLPDPASRTPCVGGAGKILKKIQVWLSIRRQGVRRR